MVPAEVGKVSRCRFSGETEGGLLGVASDVEVVSLALVLGERDMEAGTAEAPPGGACPGSVDIAYKIYLVEWEYMLFWL